MPFFPLHHADLLFSNLGGTLVNGRLTGEETSCFVLEVETAVLAKTVDEGHFSQEQVPQ